MVGEQNNGRGAWEKLNEFFTMSQLKGKLLLLKDTGLETYTLGKYVYKYSLQSFIYKKLVDIGGIPFFPEYKIAVKQNKTKQKVILIFEYPGYYFWGSIFIMRFYQQGP